MDITIEAEIKQMAKDQTQHIVEACNEMDWDDDRIPEILNEAFLYVATVMLKKHAEEILKIQEMYFDQTRKVNDKTIEILKSLITKEK